MAQQEKKMVSLRELTEEVEKLEKLRAGALAKAKERVGQLEGKSKEEIHQDADYLRCLSAYKDFSSTLDEKQKRINEIETDVEDSRSRVKDHKMMLEELMREIEKLRAEKHDAVAEVISTREEKQIADTISGISEDQTSEELQQLREMRATLRAEGKVAREMAGTDAKSQEAEFLEYAGKGQGDEEFDALIGLAGETDKGPSEPEERERSEESKLPE
jgi:chromosome segregation ATPase